MDSEVQDHSEEEKSEAGLTPKDDADRTPAAKSSEADDTTDAMVISVKDEVESMETDSPVLEKTLDSIDNSVADTSLESANRTESRMGLRRAKTKGELKKQLELKKGKLRNSLLEVNDSDSIPSPYSMTEQKNTEASLVKVPKEMPETTIKWSEGDMFWGRVTGHPWWPCMVFRDPVFSLFTRMMRVNVRAYHFHFFGSSCERGWVVESSMMTFEGKEKFEEIQKEKLAILGAKVKSRSDKSQKLALMSFDIKPNRMSSWSASVEEAEKVFQMNLEERVKYVVDVISASKKKPRRVSDDGGKRRREDQGSSQPKKIARKSEGVLKIKLPLKNPDQNETSEIPEGVDDSAIEEILEVAEAADSTPVATPALKSSLIEATPERASSTRYKLRAVRKLKKLTDDEDEEEGESKGRRKSSAASLTGEETDKSEDAQSDGCPATKPTTSGDVVRTLEIYKLSHNNSNNCKKDEVCIKCESSHPGVIKCKGPCHAPLHPACVGVELPKNEDGEISKDANFICNECIDGKHTCFICKSKDDTTVKCSLTTCCFYYHSSCIKKLKHVKDEKNAMICPMHVCASCAADTEKIPLARRGRFFRCIKCPNAYHTGDFCVAAGSLILSTSWIVCGDHHVIDSRKKHQDHLNAAFCFKCGHGGSLVCCESCPASYHMECCEEKPPAEGKWNCELCTDGKRPLYGEIVWCKAGIYRWWPGEVCHPRNIPTNIQNLPHDIGDFPVYFFGSNDYLWTHKGRVFSFQKGDKDTKQSHSRHLIGTFKKALEEADDAAIVYNEERNRTELKFMDKKPTPYKHVKSNVPIGKVEIHKIPLSEVPRCQCSSTMDNPCGAESDCINRLMMYECNAAICTGGDRCANRSIQLRLDADTEFFRTLDNRGWGLRAKTNIGKGRFIHEYVGDLIDEGECRERLRKAKEQSISNFYMLTLDKNRIIDAGPKGNNSRFMNHSCQPNCETQKWFVNGDVRVGLFTLKEVKAGDELTFNYNLECLGDKKTICNCGATVCSGYLGERPKSTSNEDKSLSAKKRKRQPKSVSKMAPVHEDVCYRCGNPGELVLCDKVNCTKSYHLKCLDLIQLPKGKWICPWHLCDEENCGKWSARLCSMCPNSFCSKHAEGNIVVCSTGRLVCDEHPANCPQLQYLLTQDHVAMENKTTGGSDAEGKVNGDAKVEKHESPFPLVSTPYVKKARGRPPKHPKIGESPILGSAVKSRRLKSFKRNHSKSEAIAANSSLNATEASSGQLFPDAFEDAQAGPTHEKPDEPRSEPGVNGVKVEDNECKEGKDHREAKQDEPATEMNSAPELEDEKSASPPHPSEGQLSPEVNLQGVDGARVDGEEEETPHRACDPVKESFSPEDQSNQESSETSRSCFKKRTQRPKKLSREEETPGAESPESSASPRKILSNGFGDEWNSSTSRRSHRKLN